MTVKEIAQYAREALSAELVTIGETKVTLATLVAAVLVVVAAFILSAMVQKALQKALARRGIGQSGAGVVGRLMHYAFVVVGVSVALQTAGIKLGSLFAAGAVFAVGIGFAMQNIAQNFVSGVILIVERTIKPGDILHVEGQVVRIVEMGIRSTLVRTLEEEIMIVPNATLVQSTVKNYTLRDSLFRLRVVVGVTYGSDMDLVRKTLEETAHAVKLRDQDKDPVVLLMGFGSSSVDWEVSVWIDDAWTANMVRSNVRENVWRAFKARDIVIAFPQLDVHFDPPVMKSLEGLGQAA